MLVAQSKTGAGAVEQSANAMMAAAGRGKRLAWNAPAANPANRTALAGLAGFTRFSILTAVCVLGTSLSHAQQITAAAATASEDTLPAVNVSAAPVADSAATEGTGSYTSGTMSSATRLNLSPRETPQSVSVVTRQQMDDNNIQSVEDIVNLTPGVTLNKGATDRVSFYSRGFQISNFTEDGMQISADGDALGFATLAMYDRVEILRGSAGMLTGAGNPSGTLNFVRKRPTAETQVSVTGSVGRYNDYRGELDASGSLNEAKTLRGRAVVAVQDTDTFISNYSHKRALVYATGEADLTRDTRLSFGFHYNDEENDGSTWYGLPTALNGQFLPFDRSVSNSPDWTYWNKTTTRVFADIEQRLAHDWKFKISAQAQKDELDSAVTGIGRVGTTNTFRHIAANEFVYDRNQRNAEVQFSGPFELLGRKHEAVFGANYRTRKTDDIGYKSVPDYSFVFNPVNWDTASAPKPDISTFYYGQQVNIKQTSVYGTTRLRVADPLSVILGARVDWYDYDTLNTFNGATSGYKVDTEVTPYVGVVLDIDRNHSVYGSWTSIFNPQSAVDTQGTLLDPVTGVNMEAGVKGEYFGGALNASAAIFRIYQENLASSLPVSQCSPGVLSCSEAAGEVRSQGYEFTVAGAITPNWQVGGGYTFNSAEYSKRQGNNAAGSRFAAERPGRLLRLTTSYRLPGELNQWRVGGGLRAQNAIFRTNNLIRQGGYSIVDLNAGYQVNKQLDLRFSITNLFDKKYYQAISSTYDSANAFGDPRSFNVTAKYKF